MWAEEVRGEGVYDTPDSCIARVIRLWLIAAMGTQLLNFLGLQAEDKNIFLADLLHDLDIGTVERADGQGTIHRELHVACPGGFSPRSRNVFAEIGSGDDLFRQEHPIVGQKHHLDLAANARVIIDHLADIVDQFNDLLGSPIPGSGFAGEHIGARHLGFDLVLNEAQILIDDAHDVEQLAFVLVYPFHMDIEEGMRIHENLGCLLNHSRQAFFIGLLDVHEGVLEPTVIRIRFQGYECIQVGNPAVTDDLAEKIGQQGVGLQQPASLRHAVGLVRKAFGPELIEVRHERGFEQLRVQGRYAVYRMAPHHGQMRHAYVLLWALFDQGHAPHAIEVSRPCRNHLFQKTRIDVIDNGQMAWQDIFQQRDWPFFQRLWKQGVVGIGRHRLGDLPRCIPGHAMFVKEYAHTFGDRQGRVGVIQMDSHLRRKSLKRGMGFEIAPKDIADGAGDQEIFLHQTEFTTGLDRIRRIQHFGNDLGSDLLLYSPQVIALVEDLHIEFIRRACREQPQVIDRLATIAHNGNVRRDTDHHAPIDPARHPLAMIDTAIDRDNARLIRTFDLPRCTIRTPEVRAFSLIAVVNFLPEQAVIVVNTIAIAWHPKGRERIEKTRRQATKPAIAQSWITLALAQLFEIDSHAQQGFLTHLKEAQVLQVCP